MAVFNSKRDMTDMFFGVKRSRWQEFSATTPNGFAIKGLLCKNRKGTGALAGALYVDEVDGFSVPGQLLMGMPEIPYPEQCEISINIGHKHAIFTEKLDGTAVIFNVLKIGDTYELLPRTRGTAVLFNNEFRPWKDMLNEVADYDAIKTACIKQNATLVFELYGSKNFHAVHYQIPLALSLHTMLQNRRILTREIIDLTAKNYKLPTVPYLVRCPADLDEIKKWGEGLAKQYEAQNDVKQGKFLKEGVVLRLEKASSASLWKYKPESMSEYHRITRRKGMPLAYRHLFFKLLETEGKITLDSAFDAAIDEFKELEDYKEFEDEFRKWNENLLNNSSKTEVASSEKD